MKANSWEWDENDLQELITLGVQEGLELDYKRCDSLINTDGKKNEISKDVSAFANSAGGTLVYGMIENGHVPTALDVGYDPNVISKEWLEQVINSRIQRRIDGVRVNQASLGSRPGKVAYVVYVPQSMRAPHQASDKKFYKRFNFESVPMEEYEIRDVSRRSEAPNLLLDLNFSTGKTTDLIQEGGVFRPVALRAIIYSDGPTPAEYAVIDIFIDRQIVVHDTGGGRKHDEFEVIEGVGTSHEMHFIQVNWGIPGRMPLFGDISYALQKEPIQLQIPVGPTEFLLAYRIRSPRMPPKVEEFKLSLAGVTATILPAP